LRFIRSGRGFRRRTIRLSAQGFRAVGSCRRIRTVRYGCGCRAVGSRRGIGTVRRSTVLAGIRRRTRVRYAIAAIKVDAVEIGTPVSRGGTAGAGQAKRVAPLVAFARFFGHATTTIQVLLTGGGTAEAGNAQGSASLVVFTLVTFDVAKTAAGTATTSAASKAWYGRGVTSAATLWRGGYQR
jgi:hypothetical protein